MLPTPTVRASAYRPTVAAAYYVAVYHQDTGTWEVVAGFLELSSAMQHAQLLASLGQCSSVFQE